MKLGLPKALCLLIASVGFIALAGDATAASTLTWQSVRLDVKHIKAGGTTFAWAELGSGAPLLLLNGTASPMNEWDPAFLAGLARSNRVIVFDYPGLGDSGTAPSAWTFEHAADWIAAFAAGVVPREQVNVLGWSMGGFIAQQLALRHPDVVKKLVLAATNPGGSKAVLGPSWVQEIDSSASSDWDYLRTNYPPEGIAAGRRFLARLDASFENGHYSPTDTPERTLNAMVAAEAPWQNSNANLNQLSSITSPTLVIDGNRDLITPPANSIVIKAQIPGALLRIFPGSGHSFLFQSPARVSSVINRFLSTST
jgi:pimeloyl-ACP methyl ester carboxylesterase